MLFSLGLSFILPFSFSLPVQVIGVPVLYKLMKQLQQMRQTKRQLQELIEHDFVALDSTMYKCLRQCNELKVFNQQEMYSKLKTLLSE